MRIKIIIYIRILFVGVLRANTQSFDIVKTTPEKAGSTKLNFR
jgi:hypothetical protein